jgi:hypothetical protein
MFSFRPQKCVVAFLLVCTLCASATAKVEAVKGKRYTLSKNHGPWMIMAAAITGVPAARRTKGMSAWEAADQLVYELRLKGIPAYTLFMDRQMGAVKEFSGGAGQQNDKKFIARHEAIAVLAGNFESRDDPQARAILDFLKQKFEPTFAKNKDSGAIFSRTPGQPNALGGAHLTPNPLMPASELKHRTVDPLIQKLNAGEEYSLTKNKGKYSLRVATFRGNSIIQVDNKVSEKASSHFNRFFGSNLDESGNKAWELCQALRSASKYGYPQNYEAYLFHDRYESYVTIVELARMFRGKPTMHQGQERERAEVFSIPRQVPIGSSPEKFWMFDLMPKLTRVP